MVALLINNKKEQHVAPILATWLVFVSLKSQTISIMQHPMLTMSTWLFRSCIIIPRCAWLPTYSSQTHASQLDFLVRFHHYTSEPPWLQNPKSTWQTLAFTPDHFNEVRTQASQLPYQGLSHRRTHICNKPLFCLFCFVLTGRQFLQLWLLQFQIYIYETNLFNSAITKKIKKKIQINKVKILVYLISSL